MARKPSKKNDSAVVAALKFVSLAQAETGEPHETHCRFVNNYVVAFNGILAAGSPIDVGGSVCPHTFRLIDALERAGESFAITVQDNFSLHIKTDKFKAVVPGLSGDGIQFVAPDPRNWPLDERFRKAADAALMFSTEGAQVVAYAAGMTGDGTLIGTNGAVFIEALHGCATPPGLIIPKAFFVALAKTPKPIVGFGFDQINAASFTVWFDDQSFLRTQLYMNERFPALDLVRGFCDAAQPVEPPKGMFDAIKAVASFNENGHVWLKGDIVQSHDNADVGATHILKKGPEAGRFVSKFLLALEGVGSKFDFTSSDKVVTFFGSVNDIQVRGCVAKSD